jgi:hypothetical protein
MKNFKKKLIHSLKCNGILFPTTESQVKEFENKHSDEYEEIPDNLKMFPRRYDIQKNTTEELAIRKVMEQIENMGSDERLTDAVIKLQEVFNLIADFNDGIER